MKNLPFYHQLITTGLGVGFCPFGPGTMGALLAVLVWYVLSLQFGYPNLMYITLGLSVAFTFIGAWSSGIAERYWGEDPSRVVIDEVVGQWITLLAVPAVFHWWHVLAAFLLFRFFDIVKPLGVRRMEALRGGWGIMADDVLAGIYGAIVLSLINLIQWG